MTRAASARTIASSSCAAFLAFDMAAACRASFVEGPGAPGVMRLCRFGGKETDQAHSIEPLGKRISSSP
jgi:hypothetical protein